MSNIQFTDTDAADPTWIDSGNEPSLLQRGAEAVLDNGGLILFMAGSLYAMYVIFMAGVPGTSITGACEYQLTHGRPIPEACRQFGYEPTDAPN